METMQIVEGLAVVVIFVSFILYGYFSWKKNNNK